VKKGQLVAELDPLLFKAAVDQAHANYVSAKASLDKSVATAAQADRVYQRELALLKESVAAQQDVDTAQTAAQTAKADIEVQRASLEQSKAQLDQATVNLSYTKIYSPIDGTVISRSVDVGQTVAASLQAPVLFSIAEDLRKMQVNTNIAEGDVGRLQEGQEASFTVDAFPGDKFLGRISQIRNAATTVSNVVTYDAVLDVENPDLRLRPGMTANVTVTFDEKKDAIAVPNTALRFRPPPEVTASAPSAAPLTSSVPVASVASNEAAPSARVPPAASRRRRPRRAASAASRARRGPTTRAPSGCSRAARPDPSRRRSASATGRTRRSSRATCTSATT
jgi:HlyD family secretion protein